MYEVSDTLVRPICESFVPWKYIALHSNTILCEAGRDHSNADLLSRLPLPVTPAEVPLHVPADTGLLLECL